MFCGGRKNYFQDAISIGQNIRIPEAENPVAFRLEPTIALDVAFVLRVLSAVDFDDQVSLVTDEIDNEAPNGRLPAEAKAAQPMSAQRRPSTLLSGGHLAPQCLGACALKSHDRPMGGGLLTPLPDRYAVRPPPQGGRCTERVAVHALVAAHVLNPPAKVGRSS